MFRKNMDNKQYIGSRLRRHFGSQKKVGKDLVQEAGGIGGFDPEALEVMGETL